MIRGFHVGMIAVVVAVVATLGVALAQSAPEFKLGFSLLASQIPDIVGEPVENEWHNPENGDGVQRTTTGLMVWRKADNWTAFTDGHRTWINGPFGLASRLNEERFPWEIDSAPISPPQGYRTLLFADDFVAGSPQLPWVPYPHFNLDNMRGVIDSAAPTGEGGVGILANDTAGGFAALAYVDRGVPADFHLESWVYVTTTGEESGPLQGLVFRVDPANSRFYRFAANFTANQELSVAYVGRDVGNFPVFLATWTGDEMPGGPVIGDGWHRIGVELVSGSAEFYWDGQQLPGGPFAIDRIPDGFVGAYATFVGGLGRAETRIDGFRAWELHR